MANIPLDTRFIGIAPGVNLYERKTNLLNAQTQPYTMADFIAASGGAVPVTKEEFDILINDNGLVPGATYEISGVDVPLYGGTTIFLQAATSNTLALSGHGVFYNPKYDQSVPYNGYGIWNPYMNVITYNSGVFIENEIVIGNNGAQAEYITGKLFKYISGDWTTATSITGQDSSETADFILDDYKVDSFVITSGVFNIGDPLNELYPPAGLSLYYFGNNSILFPSTDYSGDNPGFPTIITSMTSLINSNTEGTANVSFSLRQPSYAIGESTIWGGKKWINKTGNIGSSVDKYTLDSTNWELVAFNDVDYSVEIDEIHYDYEHDLIIARRDRWDNDVRGNYQYFIQSAENPIKIFQWGNGVALYDNVNLYYITGVIGNKVDNSYIDLINFIGSSCYYNKLSQGSGIYDNLYVANRSPDSLFYSNILISSYIYGNKFIGSSLEYNTLDSSSIDYNVFDYSTLYSNVLKNESNIGSNKGPFGVNGFEISSNILNSSVIYNNTLGDGVMIFYNVLNIDSFIENNIVSNYSSIQYNNLTTGRINDNEVTNNSAIRNNTLSISDNTFTNNSQINGNTVANSSYIDNNTLIIGSVSFNTLNGSFLRYNTVNYSKIENNTSSNSLIYNNNLYQISTISFNDISNYTFISENTLNDGSGISGNNIDGSYIQYNVLFHGFIEENSLDNASYIGDNYIQKSNFLNVSMDNTSILADNNINSSEIESLLLDNSNVSYLRLTNSTFNFSSSGTLVSNSINNISSDYADITSIDVFSGTIIFGDYSKQMFRNSAGVTRLGYYNASDVFTVVNVNA